MLQRFSTNFGVFSIFFDYILTFGTLVAVRFLRPFLSEISFVGAIKKPPSLPLGVYILFPLIWVAFLFFFSVYDGKKNLRIIDEFTSLSISSLLAVVTLSSILYFSYREISRLLILTFFVGNFFLLLLWRMIARGLYARRIKDKEYHQKILIIGAGPVGINISTKIESLPQTNAIIVGFLDDDPKKIAENPKVLASTDDVRLFIQKEGIDQVIIALPVYAHEKVRYIINQTNDLPVRITVIPDFFHLTLNRMVLNNIFGIPLLDLRASALNEYQRLLKRVFDVVITSIILIPGIPMMIFVYLVILIIDGRPVILSQKRVGENGELFRMIKFRTMVRDAHKDFEKMLTRDELGRPVYKVKDDPRVTPLGKVLRRLSLDEFPQFFQVLRGTMSLVGPRPELPEIVDTYEPWQRLRLTVPQGVTGWWQVQGRSDKPLHLHIEDDLYYINNYSIWLDFLILIKTVWILLRGKGAY